MQWPAVCGVDTVDGGAWGRWGQYTIIVGLVDASRRCTVACPGSTRVAEKPDARETWRKPATRT